MMKRLSIALVRLLRGAARGANTPARLRVWLGVSLAAALLFGVLGALGLDRRDAALAEAAEAAEQLIGVQDVQVALVRADALASENYLRGGLEDPATRAEYVQQLQQVSGGLVAVGNKVLVADAAELARVSVTLGDYAGLIEQARANNRQGFPAGAAYLRAANDAAVGMVAALRQVESSLRAQVNSDLDRADRAGVWLHLFGWPLAVMLLAGGAWMSARFRRMLNVPLAAGALTAFVVLLLAGAAQGSAMSDAEDVTSGALQRADLVAQARAAAFDAHSQEFFSLINRGNGAANELKWAEAAVDADTALSLLCDRSGDCGLSLEFDAYSAGYRDVRRLDNEEGDWDSAVTTSLGVGNGLFDSFAASSAEVAQRYTVEATDGLSASRDGLASMRIVVFLAGLATSAMCLIGYGQRLREYR
jgi:hypothetical protein